MRLKARHADMARIFLADDYESVRMAVRSSSDSELLSGLGGVQVVSSLSELKRTQRLRGGRNARSGLWG